jgi:arylsulfatase A-like enzyme
VIEEMKTCNVHCPDGIKVKGELRHTPGHVVGFLPTFINLAGGEIRTLRVTSEHPLKLSGVSISMAMALYIII